MLHWCHYEESFERDEEDVQIHDVEEVQSLIESESEALAAVSQANWARQAVKDARATRRPLPKRSTVASVSTCSRRGGFSCVVVLTRAVTVLIGTHRPGRLRRDRNTIRNSRRSVARRRCFNESCDLYNPFVFFTDRELVPCRTTCVG